MLLAFVATGAFTYSHPRFFGGSSGPRDPCIPTLMDLQQRRTITACDMRRVHNLGTNIALLASDIHGVDVWSQREEARRQSQRGTFRSRGLSAGSSGLESLMSCLLDAAWLRLFTGACERTSDHEKADHRHLGGPEGGRWMCAPTFQHHESRHRKDQES